MGRRAECRAVLTGGDIKELQIARDRQPVYHATGLGWAIALQVAAIGRMLYLCKFITMNQNYLYKNAPPHPDGRHFS